MTFAVGSTVEQRYPGASQELARASARDRGEAFRLAGWEVREERWVPDSVAAAFDGQGAASASGALVVVFVATRETTLPLTLMAQAPAPDPGLRLTGYLVRLVVGIIVFLIVLAILFSVGLPILGTLTGTGTPKPLGR